MTGFINVNKQAGKSSAQEVAKIKHYTGVPCGHLGTLDPMASGVLPVAIGNAARLFDYFLDKHKKYIATFKFGADSDTLDTTGSVICDAGLIPLKSEIISVLGEFEGEIEQIPPKYSAKNLSGKRGYELARAGIDFELPAKKVNIYSIKLIEQTSVDSFSFEIECGGGTYIRSIARDLAKRLNTCAIMSALERTAAGLFTIENAVKTEVLSSDNINNFIIPTESVLPYPDFYPTYSEGRKLFNGLSVKSDLPEGIYKLFYTDGTFYGLAEVKQSYLKMRKKLC